MKIHATITTDPQHLECVAGSSMTVPGLAVSAAELFRRRSLGLPMGVGVHGVTDIPEGMSYEQARLEALRYVRMNEIALESAQAAAQAAASPADPSGAQE